MTNLGAPTQITARERLWVLGLAVIASIIAVWWSWQHHAFELFGDSEAHIHIARRLFDSRRPGLTQLGSVWLPFPHLIMVPFLLVDSWWRTGFAAVIPSAASYLLGCLGLYRLARKWLSPAAATIALILFAANPNLLYLQTTAMNEPLFACELIWAVLLLVEWHQDLDHQKLGNHRRPTPLGVIFVLVCAWSSPATMAGFSPSLPGSAWLFACIAEAVSFGANSSLPRLSCSPRPSPG